MKRQKTFDIRQNLDIEKLLIAKDKIREAFEVGQCLETEQCHVICGEGSFSALHLLNVFDPDFLQTVKDDLIKLPFKEKNNDLYSFWQAPDLKAVDIDSLRKLKDILSSEWFIDFLMEMTGIELFADHFPDIAGQIYKNGDYLLCHDDDIKKSDSVRRIAFIIYLVDKQWDPYIDGGQLDLFTAADNGKPGEIAASICPTWNSIALFEVTPTSFHQVREIISQNKDRVSITGWFYGYKREFLDSISTIELTSLQNSFVTTKDELASWINKDYLQPENMKQICKKFIDESAISLRKFIRQDIYDELLDEIETKKLERFCCANQACYDLVKLEQGDSLLFQFSLFLKSRDFAGWLQSVLEVECKSILSVSCQKHGRGSYSLMSDQAKEPNGLDLIFHCSKNEWNDGVGGEIVYISEDETLLSVSPRSNELTLVFRNDSDILRFSKYINNRAGNSNFFRLNYVYEVIE